MANKTSNESIAVIDNPSMTNPLIHPVSRMALRALNNVSPKQIPSSAIIPPILSKTTQDNPPQTFMPTANIFGSFSMLSDPSQTLQVHSPTEMPSPLETLSQGSFQSGYAQNPPKSSTNRFSKQSPVHPKTPLESIQYQLGKTQTLLSELLGSPDAMTRMAQELGPRATFEDILAYVMFKIAKEEEGKVKERLEMLENGGHPGVKGWLSNRASDLAGVVGGIAGGAAGAYFGGAANTAPGAAAGKDLLKRLTSSYTGYYSEDAESRQILFEKLKQQMNKLSELMQCISNALNSIHTTIKNTASNIRA